MGRWESVVLALWAEQEERWKLPSVRKEATIGSLGAATKVFSSMLSGTCPSLPAPPFSFLTCINSFPWPLACVPFSDSSFLQAWPRFCLRPLFLAVALSGLWANRWDPDILPGLGGWWRTCLTAKWESNCESKLPSWEKALLLPLQTSVCNYIFPVIKCLAAI